jgi:hypothetical protein
MLASGNAASPAGALDSACGAGEDSSKAGADSSSATAALGSSPSQVKSVDFLESTQLVVNPVRLPNQMYYSGKTFTYRLDRTTVTVGAPRILEMSTSPTSVGASSWASVAAGSTATAAASSLFRRQLGAGASTAPRVPPRWGLGYDCLQPTLPPYPSRLRPPALHGRKAKSPASNGVSSSAHYIKTQVLDYPTQGSLPHAMWSP